jgi:hypothetical protein
VLRHESETLRKVGYENEFRVRIWQLAEYIFCIKWVIPEVPYLHVQRCIFVEGGVVDIGTVEAQIPSWERHLSLVSISAVD